MMKHSKDYSSIDWEKIVEYSEESKTGLRYVISKETAGRKSSQTAFNSNRIGWILSYKGSRWLVHRIIRHIKQGGIQKDDVVDHRDGNPYNNLLSNLRITDQSTNLKNKCRQSNNTSGINGVRICSQKHRRRFVRATFKSHGKAQSKSFRITDGDAAALAEAWLKGMQQQDGLFTERHGK